MKNQQDQRRGPWGWILPLLLLASAGAVGVVLLETSPQVPKDAPRQVAPAVGVVDLETRDVPAFVEAFGTVVAARQATVQPEVTGRVVMLNPQLVPGGLLKQGEPLLAIEENDYKIRVAEASAQLTVSQLRIEGLRAGVSVLRSRGEQVETELEYLRWNADRLKRLLDQNQAGEAEARDAYTRRASQEAALQAIRAQILEQQHEVEAAKAAVKAAESRVDAAKLALSRTRVQVPFDAVVLDEAVEVGQRVDPQTIVATLAATDEFWVEAAVPVGRLRHIRFSEQDSRNGSTVTVTLATHDGAVGESGVVLRPLGQLDPQGRMARILVSIRDPLDLNRSSAAGREAIRLGSYVRLSIDAGTLEGVLAIPRYALRENSCVWVRDAGGRLAIRNVDIIWRRQEDVLVRDGLLPGDQLITTHLASVVPGMALDVRQAELNPRAAADPGPSAGDS